MKANAIKWAQVVMKNSRNKFKRSSANLISSASQMMKGGFHRQLPFPLNV